VQRLIDDGGRNGKVIDWLYEIAADCPKKQAHNMNDPCGARFPDLPICSFSADVIIAAEKYERDRLFKFLCNPSDVAADCQHHIRLEDYQFGRISN
jgi:hypothetical protein